MNPYDACEAAFKNGYEKGLEEGKRYVKSFLIEYNLQLKEVVEKIDAVVTFLGGE